MPASSLPLIGWLALSAGADLRWQAPAECPDRAAFLAMVERRLGRPLRGDEARIDGRIDGDARHGYALRLALAIGGRDEVRTIADRSCAALAEAAAVRVVAALASTGTVVPAPPEGAAKPSGQVDAAGSAAGNADGSGAAEGQAGSGPSAGQAGPAAESQAGSGPSGGRADSGPNAVPAGFGPDARRADSGPSGGWAGSAAERGADGAGLAPRSGGRAGSGPEGPVGPGGADGVGLDAVVGFVLRLQGGGEVGALPGPTGFGGLALGVLWPRARLEVHGVALAPRTLALGERAVWARLFAGGVQGCGRLGRGALEVPLCAGIEVGAMQGEASGLPGARRATSWWLAGALGPALVWRVTARIGVWTGLQLVVAPVRPRFEQGVGASAAVLFTPGAVSGRLAVGIELRLRDRW